MTTRSSSTVHPASDNPGRKVITIASGKGGVGKTWFAITLAQALARTGGRILLFDGDFGLANIDIQLGLSVEHDLGDVLSGQVTLAQSVTRFKPGGFDIVAGRSGSGSLASLPPKRVAEIRDHVLALAKRYDWVLVDLSAGLDQPVRTLIAETGTCMVVTTPEPTALTDAYALIKVTAAVAPETDMRVVVNMAGSEHEGKQVYNTLRKACETFLNLSPPFAGVIRRDPMVPDSIRAQTPLLTRHPNADAAADIDAVVRTLMVPA